MGIITESNDATSVRMVGRDLSRRLFYRRSRKARSTFGIEDAFKEVDLSGSTLKEDLFLKSFDHHALIVLAPAKGVTATSQGLADLLEYAEKARDICVPVFYGSAESLTALQKEIPLCGDDKKRGFDQMVILEPMCKINLPTPRQVATQIDREACAEGFYLSTEARATILANVLSQALTLTDVKAMATEISRIQKKRIREGGSGGKGVLDGQDKSRYYVISGDIDGAMAALKDARASDPFAKLEEMIGLREVKSMVEELKATIENKLWDLEHGEEVDENAGLRLLFMGNPGTGKTEVARIFAEILAKMKFTKSEQPWTTNDVVPAMSVKSEADMENLFKKYRNSIIFIDEFQDMRYSEGGPNALKALNPLLTAPENQGTVFIGAGYRKQIEAMLADDKINPGLVRRFETKIAFEDFSRSELEQIWKLKCKKKKLEMTPEVVTAAIDSVLKQQRAQIQPSNGGMVGSVLSDALRKQGKRVAGIRVNKEEDYAKEKKRLVFEDVYVPPAETMEQVWDEINKFAGLTDLKEMLRDIQEEEEAERAQGRTPSGTYNFVIQGPAG
jgi:AAA+ superfamily predicted ATPase